MVAGGPGLDARVRREGRGGPRAPCWRRDLRAWPTAAGGLLGAQHCDLECSPERGQSLCSHRAPPGSTESRRSQGCPRLAVSPVSSGRRTAGHAGPSALEEEGPRGAHRDAAGAGARLRMSRGVPQGPSLLCRGGPGYLGLGG